MLSSTHSFPQLLLKCVPGLLGPAPLSQGALSFLLHAGQCVKRLCLCFISIWFSRETLSPAEPGTGSLLSAAPSTVPGMEKVLSKY